MIGTWNANDLANKIDWEGGIPEFFLYYSNPESWENTPLEEVVNNFVNAYADLEEKLSDLGAHPSDIEDGPEDGDYDDGEDEEEDD